MVQAVVPPHGGYPGGNTAEGKKALGPRHPTVSTNLRPAQKICVELGLRWSPPGALPGNLEPAETLFSPGEHLHLFQICLKQIKTSQATGKFK
jgi:hypothetical protein